MSPRTINAPISDQRGEFVYLYEVNHSGGVLRVTNSSANLTALSEDWTAVGARLVHEGAPERPEQKAQGTNLMLYGVDQTITNLIQANNFRGYLLSIYLLHYDPDTGAIDTPDLIFQGRQNGDWQVTETRTPGSTESGGQVEVSTRITADLASVNAKVSTRTNVVSHEQFIRRSGTLVGNPDDKFFARVRSLVNKTIYWGKMAPDTPGTLGPDLRGTGDEGDGGEVVF